MPQIITPDSSLLLSLANSPITGPQGAANTQATLASTQAQQIQNQINQAKVPYAAQTAQTALQQAQQAAQATTIANHTARANYLANKAADIMALPKDQQEEAYQQLIPDLQSMGYDTSRMADSFTPDEQEFFKQMATTAPQDAASRQAQAEMAKQALVNLGTANVANINAAAKLAAAKAKAAATPSEGTKADQTQFVKDFANINQNVEQGQDIADKAQQIKALIQNNTGLNLTGPIAGNIPVQLAPNQIQEIQTLVTQIGLNKIKGFHLGRMTQYEFKKIMGATGANATLNSDVVMKFMNDLQGDYQRNLMQQKFYDNYQKNGNMSGDDAGYQWQNYYNSKVNKWTNSNIESVAKKLNITPEQLVYKLRGQGWEVNDYVAPKQ